MKRKGRTRKGQKRRKLQDFVLRLQWDREERVDYGAERGRQQHVARPSKIKKLNQITEVY
jgi:hypothetical protein